jgi:methyl-accepting chemotaxis protein
VQPVTEAVRVTEAAEEQPVDCDAKRHTMTLKRRAILATGLVLLSLLSLMAVGLAAMRVSGMNDNKARVYQLLQSTYATVSELEQAAAGGLLTEAQAKEVATQILRNNIYSETEYVYVADENLNFIAAPLDPELHGTSFHDFRDSAGNSVGNILLRAVENSDGGVAEYTWALRQDDGSVESKLSIARLSDRWNWVVGTGIGFNEVNARFWSTARWQLFIALILAAGIGCFLFWMFRSVLKTLGGEPDAVQLIVQRVADGDLSLSDIDHNIDSNSILGAAVRMRESLHDVLMRVRQSVEQLHYEVEVAEGRAHDVGRVVALQQEETTMVATAMKEMSSSADMVSESANNAAAATQQADTDGRRARQTMQSAVGSIERLAEQISDASRVIGSLADNVTDIVSVLDVIRGVAEQTNLLALNAAIEAARAGEQGRGFAVVADEVRNLARRTQESTSEIQSMIERLEESSRNAIRSMDESRQSGESTVGETREGAAALAEIVLALSTISDMNHQIASAAEQQTTVSADITQRVNRIADSSQDTLALSESNQESATALRKLSEVLEEQVAKFRV